VSDETLLTLILWSAALALVLLFAGLTERYATPAALARRRERAARRREYPLEPFRDTHSQTQEMAYLLEPYRQEVSR
jgi:hypothetical protein